MKHDHTEIVLFITRAKTPEKIEQAYKWIDRNITDRGYYNMYIAILGLQEQINKIPTDPTGYIKEDTERIKK